MPNKNRAVAQCPKLGSILFAVMKTDGTPIKDATVSVAGPTPGTAKTDKDGFAQFPDRAPGSYTATVTLDNAQSGLKLQAYDKALEVSEGSEAYGIAKAKAVGKLMIEIYDDLGRPVKEVVQFAASGGDSRTEQGKNQHQTQFEDLTEGVYTATAQLPADLYDTATASKADIKVPAGGTGKARLVVNIVNVAKPKIGIDKKEIKCGYQPPKDKPKEDIHVFPPKKGASEKPAEIARIMLSYEETRPEKPYKEDGLLSFSGAEVEVFRDQECKTPLVNSQGSFRIANGELKSGATVYARGKSAGDLTAMLSLIAPADQNIRVAAPAQAPLATKQINIVEPKIEVEYKVALLDRDMAQHQKLADSKAGSAKVAKDAEIRPDPTYILLSAKQSDTGPRYAGGGKIEFSPGNVDAFADKECKTKFDASKPLTHDQLFGATLLKLFLRGKTAGKFTPKLTLDPSANGLIEVLGPAEGEMGVVELKLKVHYYKKDDVNKAVNPDVPDFNTYWNELKNLVLDQTVLTDAEKITPGRMLHTQNAGSHARAKIVLEKLDAGQWPDGTDDYQIVLDQAKSSDDATGSVTPYDAETDGTQWALPYKDIKVSQAKAQDQTFWLEGTATAKGWRDVRFDAGLDRPDAGPGHEVKRNGDFAHFTVVEIEEVKIDYTPVPNEAVAWDNPKFYINFKADPDGRKIDIKAKLKPALEGVTIHHMLAPDKDNLKAANWGVVLPDQTLPDGRAWKWEWEKIDENVKHKDKNDRKKLLHLSEETKKESVGNVYAKKELILSRFGGDKFQPAAYIDQDPHLAKYVNGHTDLEKRKPKFGAEVIEVWRKFWYQEVKVQGVNVAGFGNAADTYRDIKVIMEAGPVVEMPRATADALSPKAIYPKHMLSYYLDTVTNTFLNNYPNDNSDGLMVGDDNESTFFALALPAADKPVMIPMMNVNGLWVANGNTGLINSPWIDLTATPFPLTISTGNGDKQLIDPPLQGGNLLVSGTWQAEDWDPAANGGAGAWVNARNGPLAAANISLDSGRSDPRRALVSQPAGLVLAAKTRVKVSATLQAAQNFLGTSYDDGIVNCYTPNDVADYINTINHELGHSFHQTTKVRPTGIPEHPYQYDHNGPHCSYPETPIANATNEVNSGTCKCLMFELGPIPNSLNRYCPVCHAYTLVQDWRK
jgi:hypothetical protein